MTDRKAHLRGVNDIPTRMNAPALRATRAQRANVLARLEHQKTLLERQLDVWRKQQVVTERRLQMIRTQIQVAAQALKIARPALPARARPSLGAGARTPAAAAPGRRHEIEFTF